MESIHYVSRVVVLKWPTGCHFLFFMHDTAAVVLVSAAD